MDKPRNEEQNRQRSFTRRAAVLGGLKLALLGALGSRMYQLQVLEADRYRLLAEDNRISMRLLPPPRGQILDRYGVPLAVNRQNYQILLIPEQVRDLEETLSALSSIVTLSEADRRRIDQDIRRKRSFLPVKLRENLTWDQVSQIEVNAPDLPGVLIDVGQSRHYPFGPVLAHVVGHVGVVSEQDLTGEPLLEIPGFRIGKTGVERQHDEALRGSAGSSRLEVNAVGRVMQELSRNEGRPGREVVLTLDAALQGYVHRRLIGERGAAAVVLDVQNGDVLALTSVPSFDPMPFSLGLSAAEWRRLTSDPLTPLNNRAITGTYAPGSTFKMVVALAALEQGIGAGHRVWCPGFMDLGNHRFHCWRRQGHGWLEMHDAIAQSCDVYFYELARRLGVDRIADMAGRFGLGAPTGIDLPGERGGLVPTRAWKQGALGETWQGGESLITAIGQGYMLTTPLQLAVMTARMVNGGKAVVPHVTRGLRDSESGEELFKDPAPSLGIPEAHLKVILDAMDAVTNHRRGTAWRARIEEAGWEMGGKTGTSQVRRISTAERAAGIIANEDLPWRRRDHALFVGYAPVDRPRYACAVVVEHGGGGASTAAPIARDVLIETQRRDPAGAGPLAPIAALAPEQS